MLRQLHSIVMAVDDFEVSRAFYTDALALEQVGSDENSIRVKIGPTTLELRADEPDAGSADQPSVDHFAFNVDNIDETYSALRDRVPFKAPPHTTEVGHRNMQRALLAFDDPNGFGIQIAETVDTRDHLEGRRQAKEEMASQGNGGLLRGFDHISTYCTDFATVRAFYTEQLGLEEFFYSNTREEGEVVAAGFEQAAFAIGGTDIELASDENWNDVRTDRIRRLEFTADNAEESFGQAQSSGATAIESHAMTLLHPDGLPVGITQ